MRFTSVFLTVLGVLSPVSLTAQTPTDDTLKVWHRLEIQSQSYSKFFPSLHEYFGNPDEDAVGRLSTLADVAEDHLLAASDLLYLLDKIPEPDKRMIAIGTVMSRLRQYAGELDHRAKSVSIALENPAGINTRDVRKVALRLRDELRKDSRLLSSLADDILENTSSRGSVRKKSRTTP